MLTTTLAVALAFSAPLVLHVVGAGFDEARFTLALRLTWILLPIVPLLALCGLMSGLFHAEKIFLIPTVLPGVTAVVTALAVWFLGQAWGVASFAAGFTVGLFMQAGLSMLLLHRRGLSLSFRTPWAEPRTLRLLADSWPLILGAAGSGVMIMVDRSMASRLPAGSIAALGYADKINSLALFLIASLQAAVFPYFADLAGQGRGDDLRTEFRRSLHLVWFLLGPLSLILVVFNQSVVRILLQRGEFDAAATGITGSALLAYALGLLPLAFGSVTVRMAQALRRFHLIGFQGASNAILKLGLNALLIPIFGCMGVPLATSAVSVIALIILLVPMRVQVGANAGALWRPLAAMLAALAGMGAILLAGRGFVVAATGNLAGELIRLAAITLLGLLAYWRLACILGLEEARAVLPLVVRFLRARKAR
jgi:putative peptidoglycan lipid II flippase